MKSSVISKLDSRLEKFFKRISLGEIILFIIVLIIMGAILGIW